MLSSIPAEKFPECVKFHNWAQLFLECSSVVENHYNHFESRFELLKATGRVFVCLLRRLESVFGLPSHNPSDSIHAAAIIPPWPDAFCEIHRNAFFIWASDLNSGCRTIQICGLAFWVIPTFQMDFEESNFSWGANEDDRVVWWKQKRSRCHQGNFQDLGRISPARLDQSGSPLNERNFAQ